MKKLRYTLLELKKESRKTCDFCSSRYGLDNKPVNEIITRREENNELIGADVVCENCKEKFENDEITKCDRCGRLQTRHFVDVLSGKYNCYCVISNENLEEKELPSVPYERESMTAFYERQINALREEKAIVEETVEMEREMHEASLKATNRWYTEYQNADKADLLKRVVELEQEKELLEEQTRIESYEKEIAELKEQVEQLSKQQTTQVEVPPKEKGIKGFFKFGSKK